jgi:transcriptional regulatory protein LevR
MGSITAIFVVGGFAASPYLMGRIREAFRDKVQEIIVPPYSGSAVCQGAVALALHLPGGGIVTRIARKKYGIKIMLGFVEGVDPLEYEVCVNGVKKCRNRMQVFLQKDTVVDVVQYITKYYET